MKLIYYKSDIGNIGDDLNLWLWSRVFGEEVLEKEDESCLIGVGSILDNNLDLFNESKEYKVKYVFGTGVRSINSNLKLDKSFKSYFYRGPLSAFKIEKAISNYISDGAYLLAFTDYYKRIKLKPKKHKVGFVPYFKSVNIVNWEKLCKENSWHYISPCSKDIEFTLDEIASCEFIITEAMHGAIFADIFRIPWKRFRFYAHIYETESVSEFKWNDWLASIDLDNSNYWSIPYFNLELFPRRIFKKYYKKKQYMVVKNILLKRFNEDASFSMSDEIIFDSILEKLKVVIEEFTETVLQPN